MTGPTLYDANRITLTADSKMLAVVNLYTGHVSVYSTVSRRRVSTTSTKRRTAAAQYTPGGNTLALVESFGRRSDGLYLFAAGSGRLLRVLHPPARCLTAKSVRAPSQRLSAEASHSREVVALPGPYTPTVGVHGLYIGISQPTRQRPSRFPASDMAPRSSRRPVEAAWH